MTPPSPSPSVVPLAYRQSGPRRRYVVPATLLAAGVYLCVGCIPIPSTQQYTSQGTLKPSYAVGSEASAPVRLGHTTIYQAVDVIVDRLAAAPGFTPSPEARVSIAARLRENVLRFEDGRHWAFRYRLRTGYLIGICGSGPMEKTQYLVLDVDEHGTVTNYHTVDRLGRGDPLLDGLTFTRPFAPPESPDPPRVRLRYPSTAPAGTQP